MAYLFKSILLTEILFAGAVVVLGCFFNLLVTKMKEQQAPFRTIILMLVLALGLRILWIGLTQPVPQSDFAVYWNYAHRFYQGNLDYNVIERHPGIILLYTLGFHLLGPSLITGWVVNLLFSLLFLLVLYQLTRDLFGPKAALLALGLGATLPYLISYSALMASEIPAVTFFLMIIWVALQTRFIKQHPRLIWMGLGVLIYGAVLVRSTALLLLGLIPIGILLCRRDFLKPALKGCAVMIVTAVLLLGTWVTHQTLITGVPKLFYGEELWLVFATQYDHGGSVTDKMPFADQFERLNDGTMAGRLRSYRMLKEESLNIIRRDPGRYLRFGFVRMQNILWSAKSGLLWTVKASHVFPAHDKLIRRLCEVSTHFWRILLLLAPLGLCCLARPNSPLSREGQVLIVLFLAFWLTFHYLIAVASERYAFQIIPFVLMLASGGILFVSQRLSAWCKAKAEPDVGIHDLSHASGSVTNSST